MSKVSIEVDTSKKTIDVIINGKKIKDVRYVNISTPYEGAPDDYKMVTINTISVAESMVEDGEENEVETISYTYAKLLEDLHETD